MSEYGANGADALDDTLAIQNAIDDASKLPGASVSLPAGTYYVSDTTPLDSVALRIDGASGLTLAGDGIASTHLVLQSERDAHMIAISQSRNVKVSSLAMDGRRAGRKHTHGIRVADSENLTLEQLSIRAVAHYGIGLQQGRLRNIAIQHVRIDDTGGDGIDFKNTENANEGLVIHDVRISRPGQVSAKQAGVDVRGPAQISNLVVVGVPSGATGIRFREDGPQTGRGGHRSRLARFEVAGDVGSSGVAIAADDVTISSGAIVGTDTGVIILGDAASVRNVTVRGARYAFRVTANARNAALDSCQGHASRAGLWLEGPGTVIRSSSFEHNQSCGACIRPSAANTQLISNSFTGNGIAVDDRGIGTRLLTR